MRLFPIAMVVLMAALSGGEEELFGSTNFLRSFIARKKLDEQHVGVAFNILTGLPYHLTLFSDPEYDIDPFSAKSRFEIRQLRTGKIVALLLVLLLVACAQRLSFIFQLATFKKSLPLTCTWTTFAACL